MPTRFKLRTKSPLLRFGMTSSRSGQRPPRAVKFSEGKVRTTAFTVTEKFQGAKGRPYILTIRGLIHGAATQVSASLLSSPAITSSPTRLPSPDTAVSIVTEYSENL